MKPTGKKAKKSEVKTPEVRQPKKGRKVRKHHGDLGVPSYKAVKKAVVVAPVQPSKKSAPLNCDQVALADLHAPAFGFNVLYKARDSVTVECTCAATGGKTVRTVRSGRFQA